MRDHQLNKAHDGLFYAWTVIHLSALAGVVSVLIWTRSPWLLIPLAFAAGFLWTQISLLVHDVLHGQVSRKNRAIRKVLSFFLGNLVVGLSDDWWEPKHMEHHKFPNHIDKDPDIKSRFFAVDIKQLAGKSHLERFFARHQQWLFLCLIPLQAFSFRQASVAFLLKKKGKARFFGILGIALHITMFCALLVFLGLWQGLIFGFASQAVFGTYNSLIFAPNHKGMPVVEDGHNLDFVELQVTTARNVKGGWFFWYVSGGLDAQIEHHLFPKMSRFNLRKAQPITERYCKERGISYTSASIIGSYGQWLRHFRLVGRHA